MAILKIGKAHNEAGKKFFVSENLQELEGVLYFVDDIIFHTGNFHVGNNITGNGSVESPFDWKGFSIQNSESTVVSNKVISIKQGSGTTFSVSESGVATISIDLSNYVGTTVSITGNGSKLSLNGVWSLMGGNSVKFSSETDKHTAYLFSNDIACEYPVLKAKSNKSGADREYLLLNAEGEVPIGNLPIATNSTPGLVHVNGNNLSLSQNGLIGWTGFTAKSSNGTLLSSVIKELKAGENIEFTVDGNVLTINASASQTVTVDSSLSSTSANPVQNKVVYSELNKKITDPGSGSNGQFLSKTANGYQWVDAPQGGGTNITVDTTLSTTSTNPVQNKVVTAELNKKISDPGSGQVGQVLSKTANGYQWVNQNTGGSSGTGVDISQILIQRPVSDYELFPRIEASNSTNFSDSSTIIIDPSEDPSDKEYIKVYDVEGEWIDFPAESGLGTPFDGTSISVNMSKFSELVQPYYVRYCWKVADGSESNYKSTVFPSVHLSSSQTVKNPVAGFDFGLVIRVLTQEEFDSLESKDGNTLYFVTE